MPVYRLSKHILFPPVEDADEGLLAIGGDLSSERLLAAYRQGIFPWYSEGDPLLWWAPDPRTVIIPGEVHVSRRLARRLRQGAFQFTMDTKFPQVMAECAVAPRPQQEGTWITPEMIAAYCRLHRLGFAHSIECWEGTELAGGLYGVSLGGCFFGESMFTKRPDGSKAALILLDRLCRQWGFVLIDCQLMNPHLARMGAKEIPRSEYMCLLEKGLAMETRQGSWSGVPLPPLPG